MDGDHSIPTKPGRDVFQSWNEAEIHRVAQRILLDEFAPRYEVVNKDGNLLCSASSLQKFLEYPEGPLRDIGREVGQNICQQKLDNKFREEEARKSAILESALDCIVTMDVQGSIVDFNAAAEMTFGYTQKQVRGRPLTDVIIPGRFREAHQLGFRRFLETGKSRILGQRLELEALRSDGSQFPAELAINVSTTRDGTPFFTGYMRDISDRKQAELAVAERDATIRSLLNATAVGIYGLDDQGNCTFRSQAGDMKRRTCVWPKNLPAGLRLPLITHACSNRGSEPTRQRSRLAKWKRYRIRLRSRRSSRMFDR